MRYLMILIVFVSCAEGLLSQDFWWELGLLCLRWDCLREYGIVKCGRRRSGRTRCVSVCEREGPSIGAS